MHRFPFRFHVPQGQFMHAVLFMYAVPFMYEVQFMHAVLFMYAVPFMYAVQFIPEITASTRRLSAASFCTDGAKGGLTVVAHD